MKMELQGLLQALKSKKTITVNLFDEKGLLIISFNQPGYQALDDFLLDDEVTGIEIVNLFCINVTIDTEPDGNMSGDPDPGNTDPTDPSGPTDPSNP